MNNFRQRGTRRGLEMILKVRVSKVGQLIKGGYQSSFLNGNIPNSIADFSSLRKILKKNCILISCL